jgi:hypothetical protein
MTIDLQNALANILLEDVATAFPAGSILEMRSGASPGAENAATGILLASITLPATPWAAASAGVLAKSGTWEDTAADSTGAMAHYRLKNAGDTRRIDGTITVTGGGGDMTVDNTSVVVAQNVLVTSFQYTL